MTEDQGKKPEKSGCLRTLLFGSTFCVMCTAFSVLCAVLLISILLVGLNVPVGLEAPSVGGLTILVYRECVVPTIKFLAQIATSFFPWPFIATVILVVVLCYPNKIERILSWIGKFEGFGIKYERNSTKAPNEALRKELGEAELGVERANKELKDAYVTAGQYASELRDKFEISKLVSDLAVGVASLSSVPCPEDYRLTLYIPDLVFDDRLYQFAEYYDKSGNRKTQDKVGRVFSIRYGVIGRVWRSGVNEIEGDLLSQEDRNQVRRESLDRENPVHLGRFIARRWGLTLDEVDYISRYNSYGAVRIDRASNKPVGLIYFDSQEQNAFGNRDQAERLMQAIEGLIKGSPLFNRLVEISQDVEPWAGKIKILKSSK